MRSSFGSSPPLPFAAVLAIVMLAGCSEEGPTATEVCARRAKVVCAKRSQCSQTYSITRDNGTLDLCEADERATCVESVTRTGSGNTPARAETCTKAMEAQTCDQRAAGVELAACETSVGKFTDGTSCISSNQCRSSYCDIPPGQPCGKCARKVAVAAACDQTSDCQEGNYCQREATQAMGVCVAFQAEGQPCNDWTPLRCADGASCVGASRTNMTDGTCITPMAALDAPCDDRTTICTRGLRCVGIVTSSGVVTTPGACKTLRAAVGDPCDRRNRRDVDCDSTIGLYCHHEMVMDPATGMMRAADTGTCAKRAFAKTGESCGTLATGVTTMCEAGGVCQRPLGLTGLPDTNMPGTCVARASDGQACNTNPDIGPNCRPGHSCVLNMPGVDTSGTCRRRDYEAVCLMK